jgi:hypothetical protein
VIKREPVAFGAAIQGVIAAILALTAAFGVWTPTDDQIAAIMGVWVAVIGVIAAWQRSKVSPVGDAPIVDEEIVEPVAEEIVE